MLRKHPLCVLLLVVLVSVSGDAIITSEVAVEIGDDATLDCTTANIVEANVNWYHNGKPVSSDGSLLHDRRSAILFLQNATLADGGSYSCMTGTNVTLQSYSVSIGLLPRGPEIFQCRSNDFALVTCEWSRLPETHLQTDVECEFTTERDITNNTTWTKCLHFNASRGLQEFHDLPRFHVRLVLKNALGVLVHTPEDGEFRIKDHTTPHPPRNVEIKATANCHGKSLLNVTWQNPTDITENFSNKHFGHFEVELTPGSAIPWNLTHKNMSPTQCMMWYPNMPMNETYCVRVRFVSPKNGSWSERACSLRSPDEIACERGGRVQLACPNVGQSSAAANETAVAWYHNGILMPGETDTLLSITNISLEEGGNYSCMPGGGAQVASYNVMIGSKPQEISLECSSNDFENIICKWDPIPDTNLPTNILCEYAEG
ncbi:uncharacterized protein [Diadema antillarum]|uniref:uncharacterized protein n=1 Tax=Diadema antillarum TaxID=105358 RepID=UPI003A896842